ncbi:MAG: BrnA antitoxin family protein [Gammaproteobacteria bacterium]|nr:BrnA antitoxin family protein [Gammaproteobacteria bacterium]
MKSTSKTNLKKLKAMKDADINLTDIPELDDDFFKNAEVVMPPKESLTLRVDTDVLTWFRHTGKGYQTRINKLLRRYMETQTHR